MRAHAPANAFLPQGQALLHAKAVLFIDDHQRQFGKAHFLLKQRVGAHHHWGAASNLLQGAGAGLALEFAGQPGDFDTQRREPFAEVDEVLLGKNLGGGHQRHLIAGLQSLKCGKSGDHGLACADIALHQAQHRLALAEVVGDFRADALLCAGGGKPQVGQVLLRQGFRQGQCWGLLRANAFAQALQRQLVSQQFLEGQAMLGPVAAFGQFFQVGIRRRSMQIANGLIERAELVIVGQLTRQPIRQAVRAEARQGLFTELTQTLLG